MSVKQRAATAFLFAINSFLAGFFVNVPAVVAEAPITTESAAQTAPDNGRPVSVCELSTLDSPYISVDSWVYPAVFRLYGLGYIDTVFLNMRPWTRASLDHALEQAAARIEDAHDSSDVTANEAWQIYESLDRELHPDTQGPCLAFKGHARVESA